MKADDSGDDVLPGLGVGEYPGSRVLHILEPAKDFGREPRQDSIIVVHAGGDEGMDEGLSHRSEDVFQVIKSYFCDGFHV